MNIMIIGSSARLKSVMENLLMKKHTVILVKSFEAVVASAPRFGPQIVIFDNSGFPIDITGTIIYLGSLGPKKYLLLDQTSRPKGLSNELQKQVFIIGHKLLMVELMEAIEAECR